MKLKSLLALTVSFSVLFGCVKGPKGDTGPAGTNGTNGIDGNADVHGYVANITPTNWGWDATNKISYTDIVVSGITADIVSRGSVNVFMSTTTGSWFALPYTYIGSPTITYNYAYIAGRLSVFAQNTDLTPVAPSMQVKVVVISAAQKAAHPKTNWKDYNQVMQVVSEQPLQSTN